MKLRYRPGPSHLDRLRRRAIALSGRDALPERKSWRRHWLPDMICAKLLSFSKGANTSIEGEGGFRIYSDSKCVLRTEFRWNLPYEKLTFERLWPSRLVRIFWRGGVLAKYDPSSVVKGGGPRRNFPPHGNREDRARNLVLSCSGIKFRSWVRNSRNIW